MIRKTKIIKFAMVREERKLKNDSLRYMLDHDDDEAPEYSTSVSLSFRDCRKALLAFLQLRSCQLDATFHEI